MSGMIRMLTALALAAAAGQTRAQVSLSTVRLTNVDTCTAVGDNREPVIAVSRTNGNKVVVGWQTGSTPIQYAVSTDGARTFTCPDSLAIPERPPNSADFIAGDPMITAMANGDIYVGGLALENSLPHSHYMMALARIPAASTVAESAEQIVPNLFGADKCLAASGPWPPLRPVGVPAPTTDETLLVAFNPFTPLTGNIRTVHSIDAMPSGSGWTFTQGAYGYPQEVFHANQTTGVLGPVPLIMRGGDNPGRTILGYSQFWRPHLLWSDTGGEPHPDPLIPEWNVGAEVSEYIDTTDPLNQNPEPLPDTLYGTGGVFPTPGINVWAWPVPTVNPSNLNELVAPFIYRTEAEPSNVDIFLARSTDQGESWLAYRITDAMLTLAGDCPTPGIPCEQDQFNVWGAMDQYGGVNLLFCRTSDPDSTPAAQVTCTVRYARWPSVQAIINRQAPILYDLSQPFQPRFARGNEYHMIVDNGCFVHAVWAGAHEGEWNIYVTTVQFNCGSADTNADGFVDQPDAPAFFAAYGAGDPLADRNRDGEVNLLDSAAFNQAYTGNP